MAHSSLEVTRGNVKEIGWNEHYERLEECCWDIRNGRWIGGSTKVSDESTHSKVASQTFGTRHSDALSAIAPSVYTSAR